jgi:hypothetical protein
VRENRTQGSARGVPGNGCPYLNQLRKMVTTKDDIDSAVDDTMKRLNLNWGLDRAMYDDAGARNLVNAHEQARQIDDQHGAARALMFLGRLLEVRKDYLGARLFYLMSKTIFGRLESMHWVPAKEYLGECSPGNKECQKIFAEREPLVEAGAISSRQLLDEYFSDHLTGEIQQAEQDDGDQTPPAVVA